MLILYFSKDIPSPIYNVKTFSMNLQIKIRIILTETFPEPQPHIGQQSQ